jgi:hypothetical protein
MPHGVSAKKKAWSASEKRWPARGFRALTEMLPNTALKWHRFWQNKAFFARFVANSGMFLAPFLATLKG